MRYPMLVEAVLQHTPPHHPDADERHGLPEVLRRMEQLVRVSRQGKMAEDTQRAALRDACARMRARPRPDAPSDGERLFAPAVGSQTALDPRSSRSARW